LYISIVIQLIREVFYAHRSSKLKVRQSCEVKVPEILDDRKECGWLDEGSMNLPPKYTNDRKAEN
jgi:hypothetical protein